MTCLNLQKMEYFFKNEPVLEDFWIGAWLDADTLDVVMECKLEICGDACTKINFLLPIMEKLKKKDISKDQKKTFFVLRCLEFPLVFEEMFANFLKSLSRKKIGYNFCK